MISVDRDTLEAIQILWATDTARLPAILSRPPQTGELKSTREQPLTLPYAQITVEDGKKSVRYSKSIRKDCRKVAIAIYGTEAQARAALEAASDLFHARMGAPGHVPLIFPSGARFIKWWPVSDGTLARESGISREGVDVWKATLEGEVWSVRAEAPEAAP